MFRHLLVPEMEEKGQRNLIHCLFPVNGKILFSNSEYYYQVHAGASWTRSREFGPSSPELPLEAQDLSQVLINLVNEHKSQGLTEGHRNLSHMQEGSSKTDHGFSCHSVLATKGLLQHYPMAESS